MMEFLLTVYHIVWGFPLLALVVGIGFYLTFALKGIQFRYFGYAMKRALIPQKEEKGEGDISNFESLMTALAGTIGIGNIAGVATALTVGGMGALFWMWIMGFLGMATKYGEAILAVKYRTSDENGEMCGGPMYFIEKGKGWRLLASSFAFFGAFAAFGGGNMLQANSVADVMQGVFQIDVWWSGVAMALIIGLTLLGGIKSIGRVASYLVPFMALFYLGGGVVILLMRYPLIPQALWTILSSAFTGQAAFGGFAGSTLMIAMQVGISRGLMTSESGLGTASIAAAAARSDHPGRQAMISMTGSFLSTVLMCTVTALVLGVTDVFGQTGAEGKLINGASLTTAAFGSVFPWGTYVVAIGILLFALTTILGWAYYGEKCLEYLIGPKMIPFYRILFTLVVIPGAVLELDIVWKISDIMNGLMAFPNLIGLFALSGVIVEETREFLGILEKERREKQVLIESGAR